MNGFAVHCLQEQLKSTNSIGDGDGHKLIYKLIDGSEYKGGFRPSHLPKRLPPIARVHDAHHSNKPSPAPK